MRSQLCAFCSPIELSLLGCSRGEIRLSAGTEAMPAWDEGCERAIGQKRQASTLACRRTKYSALKQPQLHAPAYGFPSRAPRHARDASKGCAAHESARTNRFHRSTHHRFLPAARMRAGARGPSPQRRRARREPSSASHAMKRDETRFPRRSREKNAAPP